MYIKRVIGIPGDIIQMSAKQLLINNKLANEAYINRQNNLGYKQSDFYLELPSGSYYLLGDNRDNSRDSRHWGAIPFNLIAGKVVNVYFSFHLHHGFNFDRIGKDLNNN